MFKIEITIKQDDRIIDYQGWQGERLAALIKTALKYIKELGPY